MTARACAPARVAPGGSRRRSGLRSRLSAGFRHLAVALPLLAALLHAAPAAAQESLTLSDGARAVRIELDRPRGYAALPARELGVLGWRFRQDDDRWIGRLPGVAEMRFEAGVPFVGVGEAWVQLVDAPFLLGDELYLPVQLLMDVLPDRLPEIYASDPGARSLELLQPELWGTGFSAPDAPVADARREAGPEVEASPAEAPTRVVILDPGHGGDDPGTLGLSRTREKDIALSIALAIAEELEGTPGLEVHLIRDTDVLVPLWERGQIATRIKGDRPGVFLSIHANSVPGMRDVRGFETYFLSEARTEHEARVAALENAAMELEGPAGAEGAPSEELGEILSELRNLDHQHWSSDLAARIQSEVMTVHPGRDRGVKQGPLAVLTNALMPSVLIEAGFISNPEEERLLRDPVFHRDFAREVAEAVLAFFERYPPGVPGLGATGG